MRLVKFLAHAGVASRRASEEIIRDGRVSIGGQICVDPARGVDGKSRVTVDGKRVELPDTRVVYAVNKPVGVISTASDPQGRTTVVELIPDAGRLFPVGRLDVGSSGLILLTNDGELANLLTHPKFEVPKVYRVRVGGGPIGATELRLLSEGVQLEDGITLPARVSKLGSRILEIELREGRNRQIRRMCEAVGHPVAALERIAIGPQRLGRLTEGGYRRLNTPEVDALRDAASRE
jgi:23S rRNA pseudouridine2605 synthase